jgi:hypothetical protein
MRFSSLPLPPRLLCWFVIEPTAKDPGWKMLMSISDACSRWLPFSFSSSSKVRPIARVLRCLSVLCLTFVGTPLALHATLIVPPSFKQLVGQSGYVVRAVVKSVTTEWQQSGNNRHILTRVEFDVREVISGSAPSPMVLTFLGGKIGTDELIVDGSPTFHPGDENILFVRPGNLKFFPIVALEHGQYPILRDAKTGAAHMARHDGSPLYRTQQVAEPLGSAASPAVAADAVPLTPEDFAGQVRTVFAHTHSGSVQQN